MREKTQLHNRREGFERFDTFRNPMETTMGSASFAVTADTMRTDIAQTLKQEQIQKNRTQKALTELRQERRQIREETRQALLDAKASKAHHDALALLGTCKNNAGSVPYDLTTGAAKGNAHEAEVMRYRDSMIEYSAKIRSQRLYQRSNKAGFNILSGEEKGDVIRVPERPQIPVDPKASQRTV